MVSNKRFQSLNPQRLLLELVNHQVSGCLQVTSGFVCWSLYLYQGRLTFATNSVNPFERLDRHLGYLSQQAPLLGTTIRSQIRLFYERKPFQSYGQASADYQAIQQLIAQQYLTIAQANLLIEQLAKEVLPKFLTLNEGRFEVIEKHQFESYPNICHLDLNAFLEHYSSPSPKQPERPPATSQARQILSSALPNTAIPRREQPQTTVRIASPPTMAQPPVVQASAVPSPTSAFSQPISPVPTPVFPQYKIVCIDDSPSILQAIRTYLDDQRLSVMMVNDPLKALMQIIRIKPDIILLDVTMPNLDGYELCSLVRKHPSFKHIPVIMVTGNKGFIDRARAKLVGASGYLTKPFTRPDLLKMVSTHLKGFSDVL